MLKSSQLRTAVARRLKRASLIGFFSVTICELKKKGIVHGQGTPNIMSFLMLLSRLVSSNDNGHMFLGLLRVIFLQVVAPRQPVGL